MTNAEEKAQEFLKTADYFRLGNLPTESSHPATTKLSELAEQNLPAAVALLRQVDLQALKKLQSYLPSLQEMRRAIGETFANGGRVFLCGCGATGRLSLSLEYLWRSTFPDKADSVIGFMAGGDVALVHSLEGFEDFPDYGAEQLTTLNFQPKDLLISCTEGGETPFVIGATEKAAQQSVQSPFFLYCNPAQSLQKIARSRQVLESSHIRNICLEVGPMALSGSTRMQASTVLMLAVGMALFQSEDQDLKKFIQHYEKIDLQILPEFIKKEAKTYQEQSRVLYAAEDLAITVFTDTTERAPTFSLPSFANQTSDKGDESLAYIMIPSTSSADQSWQTLLSRKPRSLEWSDRNIKTTASYLQGFDFSAQALKIRKAANPQVEHFLFSILREGNFLYWKFRDEELRLPSPQLGPLFDHILLKMLLNIHSTLLMGRLHRYVGNVMTYVLPTNGKLIDRAVRYVDFLLRRDGEKVHSYDEIIRTLFATIETLLPGEPVVVKTVEALRRSSRA